MHVLIVEDDPIVADVLGMTLEEARAFQNNGKHNRNSPIRIKA